MRTLYIDCGMGAAGDMLTAALYELLSLEEKEKFESTMNSLGLEGVKFSAEKVKKCGIGGTHMNVSFDGISEEDGLHHHDHEHAHEEECDHDHHHDHEHHHTHEHDHDHTHSHSHSKLSDICEVIEKFPLSQVVKGNASKVYTIIAQAESSVHRESIENIHFHEVGSKDAIFDITAVCLLIEMLGIEKIIASPIHVGSGHVHCAHGILPVPAPATAYILKDIPIYSTDIKGELCTPTGAALLKHFSKEFGPMPLMTVEKIGYGMGKKDFEKANCVRVLLGETKDKAADVVELSCNLDDMTGEKIGFAMDCLFEAGALDVYTVNIGMKKSRPGIMLNVLCKEEDKELIIKEIFKHTSTIGIRQYSCQRYTLDRSFETISTSFGDIRVKHSKGYGVSKDKYEYEDLVSIAKEKGISIDDVLNEISK